MSKSDTAAQERAATTDAQAQITGPHIGLDKYGSYDHDYYRCERCGEEWITSLGRKHDCLEVPADA